MRPLNPYKEIRHTNPTVDMVPYESNSVEDYLEGKDNKEEFPRGEVYGLCAYILGTQRLTIRSSEIKSLSELLEREKYFVWELTGLNEMLLAYEGVVGSLQDAYMQKAPQAILFVPKVEYEKLHCPQEGSSIIVQDSIVSYPPLLIGTRLSGFYMNSDDPTRKKWSPKKPLSPTRILQTA